MVWPLTFATSYPQRWMKDEVYHIGFAGESYGLKTLWIASHLLKCLRAICSISSTLVSGMLHMNICYNSLGISLTVGNTSLLIRNFMILCTCSFLITILRHSLGLNDILKHVVSSRSFLVSPLAPCEWAAFTVILSMNAFSGFC